MENRSNLSTFRLVGFQVFFSVSVRDDDTSDVILLDMIGPLQSIRGIWAALKQKKHNCYTLGGMTKLQKEPGHYVIKSILPSGFNNWTFVSRQAIPRLINNDLPTFVWYENKENRGTNDDIPPKNFMPMLQAAAPFPIMNEWANDMWKIGRRMNMIKRVDYSNQNNIKAYKIIMNRERWELKVTEAIQDGVISFNNINKG